LIQPNLDFVLIVKQSGATAPFERIQDEVRTLIGEAKRRWAEELECS
jgi:hypothetical protein